jgi:aminocarboxymuconate-semialdehyde decarboxylase
MYLDSVSYHLPALRCVVETMGPDHVLFGSDAPPLTVLKPKALRLVRDLGLPEADERKLLSDNVRRLFKLN